MNDSFAPTANLEKYNHRWRMLDPTLWSQQSIEGRDDTSTAHLMSLKRQISELANSANGHGSFSPTTMLGHDFSHLGLQTPFHSGSQGFHGMRYMSPNGHLGGSLCSTDSAPSECASSPDAARHSVKPFYAQYDTQEIYASPTYDEGSAFGNWAPQKVYQHSIVHSPPSYDNATACNMKDLQYTPDPDTDEDTLNDNDCIKVEVHVTEELALTPQTPTLSYRDEALGRSIRDDASSFNDEDDRYQASEADSEYSPERPKRRNSNQVKSPGRKTPKRTKSTNDKILGESKVTKNTSRKNNSARGPPNKSSKRGSDTQKQVFTCAFSHYGCDSTFGSKNEWKRHVGSQHLQLGFYRCDTGLCNPDKQSSSAKSHPSAIKTYNDFNRKDLFTQHHRRMHTPWSSSKEPSAKVKKEFEDSLEDVRKRCWYKRRAGPQRSSCGFCMRVFEGPNGWDERMEHVGKHFEGKHNGTADAENMQEEEDEDLRDWAVKEGIVEDYGTRGFWLVGMGPPEAQQTSTGRSSRRRAREQPEVKDEDDMDAEGEDEG